MNITIFRDYKEEGWESMELYADSLVRHLRPELGPGEMLREYVSLPSLSALLSPRSKLVRYLFRFGINPPVSVFVQGDINHIIDHANSHLVSVLDPDKTIVTCHDLIVPHWLERNVPSRRLTKRIKRIAEHWRINHLRRAAKVIAVSQATKDEVVRTLSISAEKIVVIPEGVDEMFRRPIQKRERDAIRRRYHLPPTFLLHVGTNHEYKNIETLLRLFHELVESTPGLWLVKTGSLFTDKQIALMRQLGIADRILHLGFIPRKDLPGIYAQASALIHPSHTEGFGFTVLEAMATGCPVIASDIPALRELAGEVACFISTSLSSGDVKSVRRFLTDSGLRQKASLLGLRRSKRYTWEACAKQTYQLYRQVWEESR